jgi:hypothetical protein
MGHIPGGIASTRLRKSSCSSARLASILFDAGMVNLAKYPPLSLMALRYLFRRTSLSSNLIAREQSKSSRNNNELLVMKLIR